MATATKTVLEQETDTGANSGGMQLVSFSLADEEYGIEITRIREIILMCEITQVPQTPPYVEGLINLRSMVIPVIDLRTRFGIPRGQATSDSRIMVLNVGSKTIGIVVDAVSEVLRVTNDQIASPPPTVAGVGREYLTGVVKMKDRLLILLDVDRIFTEEDAQVIEAVTSGLS